METKSYPNRARKAKGVAKAKEVAAMEAEEPAKPAEKRPLELNAWAPKLGFFLTRSNMKPDAIIQTVRN